jgi:hypothetical protein
MMRTLGSGVVVNRAMILGGIGVSNQCPSKVNMGKHSRSNHLLGNRSRPNIVLSNYNRSNGVLVN